MSENGLRRCARVFAPRTHFRRKCAHGVHPLIRYGGRYTDSYTNTHRDSHTPTHSGSYRPTHSSTYRERYTMKKLHPERIARLLLTTDLPTDVATEATELVALIDSGRASRSRVDQATERLVSAAWTNAAREAAQADKPKQVKLALERLRGVAQLEQLLGLSPAEEQADPEPATEAVTASETDTDVDAGTESESASAQHAFSGGY